MHRNLRTSKRLILPVFVAAMGISPAVFGDTMDQATDIDDATVAAKVRAALIADPELNTTLVRVAIDDGAVQLSGVVRTKNQENEAVKVANQVEGVKSVEDNLEVRGSPEE